MQLHGCTHTGRNICTYRINKYSHTHTHIHIHTDYGQQIHAIKDICTYTNNTILMLKHMHVYASITNTNIHFLTYIYVWKYMHSCTFTNALSTAVICFDKKNSLLEVFLCLNECSLPFLIVIFLFIWIFFGA